MHAKILCSLLGLLFLTFSRNVSVRTYDVRDFGAKGDGITLDTKAIQRAIDQCAPTGGIVVISSGTYLSGSLELKSNIELRVLTGAMILGSKNLSDYFERTPKLKSYNDVFLKYSLLYAESQTNIAITGGGTIDGQGASFKVLTNEKPAKYRNRPYVIRFVECRNVRVEGVRMQNSASWMQHYLACEDVQIRGIRVFNHANKNNDMMDIDGCRNVVVSDCIGDTDDDGITVKSTSEHVAENIAISNCVISSHCNAIKTGTESTGGFRNITISNMVVKPSSVASVMSGKAAGISGVALTVVDGGTMDGVSISNVVMDGPEVPLFVRLGNRARKHWEGAPKPGVGAIRNVSISHLVARNVKTSGCSITGIIGHPIEDFSLSDIRLEFAGAVKNAPTAHPEELEDQYPEATMFGILPSYGFYLGHVKSLRIRGLALACRQEDVRPAFLLNDVVDARIEDLDAMISPGAGAAIVLESVDDFTLAGSTLHGRTSALFRFVGDQNKQIVATGNDLRGIQNLCEPMAMTRKVLQGSGNRMNLR